jgi:hypothetical protein
MLVPASSWTLQSRQFGVVGTAYDYAAGTLWAGKDLREAFARVRAATVRYPFLSRVVGALRDVLNESIEGVRNGLRNPECDDFFRGLGLLAQLDAIFRGHAEPPSWTARLSRKRLRALELRRHLRSNYPDEFVSELRGLLEATHRHLPSGTEIVYDPSFGRPPGLEHLRADGDLIIDDLLIELKVSVRPFAGDQVWQLLGYAALDRLHGRERIARIGLYNPRLRYVWSERLDHVATMVGIGTFDAFCAWFLATPEAHSVGSRAA